MSFDKKLRKAIDTIDIPEELMPENIEAMLRAKCPVQDTEINKSAETDRASKITAKRTNRAIIMRTLAAAAACVALAAGFMAFREENSRPEPIESEIEYKAVQVESYDELYNIYTGIYLNNSGSTGAENGDGVEIITDETAITEATTTAASETTPLITEAAVPQETETLPRDTIEAVRSDFSDADIVKDDDNSIYYICDGTLYVVSKSDMSVTAQIANENSPFEMYVRGNSLVLVSEEYASDLSEQGAEDNVIVDIYDTSAGSPVHIKTYKQNGSYTSARIDDNGVLYLVTGYADYRTNPLDENADLENYVPGYYIDGEKFYVAAEDISVPQGANNTDYTVVSSIKCSDPSSVSVKAVLGSSANAYCSEDTLYVAGTGMKDNKEYTAITSFSISEAGLAYKAAAVLDGELISRYSMAESGAAFRIACRSYDENGMIVTSIYTLDDNLNTVYTAGNLLPGVIIGSVKFDDNYASLVERNVSEPALVIDLNQSSPVESADAKKFLAAYVNKFDENSMIGISAAKNENGGYSSLTLEMYDAAAGNSISEITFAELTDVNSPALTDKKAMLIDAENNIIGIPVSGKTEFGVINQYYLFSYTPETGFLQNGVIEYNDIADSYKFERAVINDGVLVIVGSGRMVSVQLSDMTVIDTCDFQ